MEWAQRLSLSPQPPTLALFAGFILEEGSSFRPSFLSTLSVLPPSTLFFGHSSTLLVTRQLLDLSGRVTGRLTATTTPPHTTPHEHTTGCPLTGQTFPFPLSFEHSNSSLPIHSIDQSVSQPVSQPVVHPPDKGKPSTDALALKQQRATFTLLSDRTRPTFHVLREPSILDLPPNSATESFTQQQQSSIQRHTAAC